MNENAFLQAVLQRQEPLPLQLVALRRMREVVEAQVCALTGCRRIYYAGSYAKNTMIKERFDLDIVAYWPPDCGYTLAGIYRAIGRALRKRWPNTRPKTVAWEIPFSGRFHIDVVPGRALDNSFRYANLYRTDTETSLKTSIKIHIDTVRDSGRCDVIKLMKLWRVRKRVPFGKSLLLELLTIEGAKGCSYTDLGEQMNAALEYMYDNILTVRVVDPANTNNVVSDELTKKQRIVIRLWARAALQAKTWMAVFSPRPASI